MIFLNSGLFGGGASMGPETTSLTDEYDTKGAVEMWPMSDASGGALAVNNTDHNLLETDGTNITYEQTFNGFPLLKGIRFVDSTDGGNKTYLRSGSSVSALRTTGDVAICFAVHCHEDIARQPYIGLADDYDATANTNVQYGASFEGRSGTFGYTRYQHGYGTNSEYDNSQSQSNNYKTGHDYFVVATRDASARTMKYYINGVAIGTKTWTAGQDQTGGSDAEMVVGRVLDSLGTAAGLGVTIGEVAVFHDYLDIFDAIDLTNAALDSQGRAGIDFVGMNMYHSGLTSVSVTNKDRLYLMQCSSAGTANISLGGLLDGESTYVAQWGTGTITLGGGPTFSGTTSTSARGKILKVTRDSASTATGTEI